MKFEFTKDNEIVAKNILSKYPPARRFSAIMPLLTLAQNQNKGHLDSNIIDYLAEYLSVTKIALYEVANFYSMYRFNPIGKYHFQFCRSVVCLVTDYAVLYDFFKNLVKITENNISEDGMFSLAKVECLGACVNAPAIRINDVFFENVTKEKIANLVKDLQEGKELALPKQVQKTAVL